MLFSMSFQPHQGRYLRVYNQAKTLVDAGYDVTLLAWDRECRFPKEEVMDGIRIKRFWIKAGVGQGPKNIVNVGKFNWAVLWYLLRHEFDIVHCFNLDAIVMGLLAAKLRRRKAILDLCEPEYYSFWEARFSWLLRGINRLERILAKRYDHVFVHNAYQVEKFRSYGISHLTQVGSYPNRSMLAKAVKNEETGGVVIGRLGTIYENNGIEELITAFRQLLSKQERHGQRVTYKLLLGGRIYDSYRQTFESLVQPLDGHVEIIGAFEAADLPRLYRRIDISIILYRRTRWFRNVTPTKLFDSLVNGVPVVVNAIGDVAQIVEKAQCGVIVDEINPDSICAGIELLASNPQLRNHMGKNALKLARKHYTWEACQERFLAGYRSL